MTQCREGGEERGRRGGWEGKSRVGDFDDFDFKGLCKTRDRAAQLARLSLSLFHIDNNHAIPLFELIDFEDITFGIFPKIGHGLREAYKLWAKNSVGDVVEMVLQCIEVPGESSTRAAACSGYS